MRKKAIESLLCTGPTSSIHTHTLDPLSVRPKAATSAAAFTNTAGGGAFVSQIKFMAISPQLLLTFSSARVQNRKKKFGLSWIQNQLTRLALRSRFRQWLKYFSWTSSHGIQKACQGIIPTNFFKCYGFPPFVVRRVACYFVKFYILRLMPEDFFRIGQAFSRLTMREFIARLLHYEL